MSETVRREMPRGGPEKTTRREEEPRAETAAMPIPDDASFPVRDLAMLQQVEDPTQEMAAINRELLAHQDYSRIRERYCHLSIRLNLEARHAPAFRVKLSVAPKRGDPALMLMHRDRVVIDYHWCHATEMDLAGNEAAHAALFNAEDFDFNAAWRLSGKNWKSKFRAAEVLCLTRHQQCQTMTLHDEELDTRLKQLGAGWHDSGGKTTSRRAKLNRGLGEWAERDGRITAERRSYELLWLVREVLGEGATHQAIAKLHALAIGGPERDRTSIRGSLQRLDKNVSVSVK